jgi:sulfhydrogenase subunit delta
MSKPRLGVFSVTGCFGCQLSLAFVQDILLELLGNFDIAAFPMLKADNDYSNIDIAFIEGFAAREEEIEELKKIRKNSRIVVALGACACNGSVPSIKEVSDKDKVMKAVYERPEIYNPIEATGIDKHIKVDYYLYGCPPNKQDLVRFIKDVLAGKINPVQVDYPVCVECRAKGNVCLLQEGEFCIGPVTNGGCSALCPSNGHYCFGCHGFWEDANMPAIISLFKKHGFDDDEIKRIFTKFACTSKILHESGALK